MGTGDDKLKKGELPMMSKMNLKPVFVLAGMGLLFLLTFQNCSKPKADSDSTQYGVSQSSSVLSSEKDMSILNLPVLPTRFDNLTEGLEIYGNCVIANTSRDFTITVTDRSGKTDCATKCNDNLTKFPGDKIQCTFPGGSSNVSIETSKNYCRIVTGGNNVKLDSYIVDRPSCISQCQIIGKDMDKNTGLKCEWQKRLLYVRVNDNPVRIDLGSCTVIAKNSKGVQVANIVFTSGTTEESCSNTVSKMKEKYMVDDVTYVFAKAEYVVIP